MKYELYGISKENKKIESLAVVSSLEVAEFHKENTFSDYAGKIIVKETTKEVDERILAVADVPSFVYLLEATMSVNDWENAKVEIKQATALQLLNEGIIHSVEDLNQVITQPVERRKLKASMILSEATSENPLATLFGEMQDNIFNFLTGDTSTSSRSSRRSETVVEEQPEEQTNEIVEEQEVQEEVVEVQTAVEESQVVETSQEETTEGQEEQAPVETVAEVSTVEETIAPQEEVQTTEVEDVFETTETIETSDTTTPQTENIEDVLDELDNLEDETNDLDDLLASL